MDSPVIQSSRGGGEGIEILYILLQIHFGCNTEAVYSHNFSVNLSTPILWYSLNIPYSLEASGTEIGVQVHYSFTYIK